MKPICLIFFIVMLGNNFDVNAQGRLSDSEKSFSKIKVRQGTTDVTLKNDYGKRWKMRVNFPEVTKATDRLIIALHWAGGGDTYKKFNDCLALPGLQAQNTIIVSPEGENQLWSTANNVEKILSIVSNSPKYWNVDPYKIAVMGYSNGGNGSWYLAEHYPNLFSAAIPMASAYPIDQKIEIPLYIIHGAKDELFEIAKTRTWVEKTKNSGTDLIFAANNTLSHFQGCSYVDDLKKAGVWLQTLWNEQ